MAGRDFSDKVSQIAQVFQAATESVNKQWDDEKAREFNTSYVISIDTALNEIKSIEYVIDKLERNLQDIIKIANE